MAPGASGNRRELQTKGPEHSNHLTPSLLPRVLGRGSEKGAPSAHEKGQVLRLQEALDTSWDADKNSALVTTTQEFRGHELESHRPGFKSLFCHLLTV